MTVAALTLAIIALFAVIVLTIALYGMGQDNEELRQRVAKLERGKEGER